MADDHWIHEMLVEVIEYVDHALLQRAANGNIVKHREMLDMFAEPHTASMRADRYAKFRRQQQDSQHLIDIAHPKGVDLAPADGVRLQQLPEDHTVLHHLVRGDLMGAIAWAIAACPQRDAHVFCGVAQRWPHSEKARVHRWRSI